jgi:hypothetical protein
VVYVQFDSNTTPFATVPVALSPANPTGVARAPANWGPRPAGLNVLDVGARIWRPDNLNGVTLHTEPEGISQR